MTDCPDPNVFKGWGKTKEETEGVTLEIENTFDIVWDIGGDGQITFDEFC